MAYTDQTKIEQYLQRTLNADEVGMLTFLIPAIKIWIDKMTGSTFDQVAETTRYFDGGYSSIDLDPCTDVTAVNLVSNEQVSEDLYTALTDYVLEPQNENVKREIVRRYGSYNRGLQRVAVTAKFSEYDGGVPEDIILVATRMAAGLIKGTANDAAAGDIKRESLEGHSIEYITSADTINSVGASDPVVMNTLSLRKQILVE